MDIIQINTNQFGTQSSSSNSLPFNSSDPFNYQVSPSNSLMFSGTSQADNLYLKVAANHLEFSTDGSYFYQINGLTLSNNTNISVNLAGNDSLYVDSSLVQALNSTGAKLSFDGGQGNNTLFGPNLDTTWNITGQNSGNVSGIEFQNVENLKAAANNYATFVFTPNGSLSGVADGGDGNLGTLVLQGGSYTSTNFIASGPHSGEILLDTKTIQYAGLAPIFDNSVTTDRVFTATNGNDQILVTKAATGQTSISSSNNTFESITFLNPSNSLTIDGLGGDDTTTIGSLDPNFTKSLVINGDSGNDSVIFANNLTLNGGNLTVNTENITVNNGVTIDTTTHGGTDGIISFTASDTESGFNASGQVQINLSGATIKAGSINMSATSTVTGSVTSLPTALVNLDSTANIAVIDSHIESSGNITIASSSTVIGTASAQGLSSYIDTSVDAAVATSIINSSAIAHISGTSSLVASGYLSVTARNNINAITNGDATAATAGAGIAVATVTSTTDAYIDSSSNQSISASNITLAADSDNSITTTAKASPGGSTQNDQTPQSRTKNNAKTSDGDVKVAGALAFTNLSSNTEAYISPTNSSIGATVTTGALTIHAASKNNTSTLADGSNVGSGATGVGVAVAINLANVTNQAYVGSKTSLNTSTTNIEALTPTTNTFVAEAISGAGSSSKVGVAGALALNNLNTSSQALLLTDAIVDANDGAVTLTAENNTSSTTKAEAAQTGAGTVGVGASVALDLEQNSAEASIQDNVSLSNAGVLTLAATSNNTSTTNVQAGAAGGTAVSPAVGLTIVGNNTLATIGAGGVLTVGSLNATAQHSGNSSTTVDA
ncbi:beta strand repeat-containing protein, partial [Nostoc sp.]